MANEITKFFEGRVAKTNAVDTFRSFSKTPVGNGRALLRLTKSGQWVMGADSEELEIGTQLYADPMSLSAGYVAWHKGQIEGEIMQPILDGPVDPGRLSPVQAKQGWQAQASLQMLLPDDEQPVQLLYKVSSIGGMRLMTRLAGEFALAMHENPSRRYAVIELGTDSYVHKEWGETFTPEFKIVKWLDEKGEEIKTRKRLV